LSMKALANTVSVLQFLAGVAFLCAAGIASAWLAGFLTIVLSLPSDLMSVTTGSDLEAYPRYLLASIAIFFVFCLLGPVDKPSPNTDASEQDEPDEAGGEFVIPSGDAPLLLEMANEAFNP